MKINKKLAVLLAIIIFGEIFSCTNIRPPVDNYPYTEQTTHTRAEQVMNALLEAYPEHIDRVEFRNEDWALLMRDKWFYFAEGKMLPEDQLVNAANYRSYQFYNYPAELPEWRAAAPEDTTRYRNWTTARNRNQIQRSNFFIENLWQARTREEMESRVAIITFFGKPTKMHQELEGKLVLIERLIQAQARNDSEVRTWMNSVTTIEGYGWRNIADSQSRSYHSYGLAIDLLPGSLGGKQTYWLWTSQHREDWWNVPYTDRYHPPAFVIKLFETYGFIWGGKWGLYDTMHFEYRPEILILSEMPPVKIAN
jgi:hypothetical protein